ncbi:MAG: DUF3047 domain-containing protein [Bdellovibrionota bacterium]|nr:DUF3047 domain-containing protein [Deltaproteobacteria bacterium]
MKILVSAFFVLAYTLSVYASSEDALTIEDFDRFKIGTINTSGWYVRDRSNSIDDVYSIEREGDNQFLHADNEGQFVQIFKKGGWSIKHRPYLSWKWRVIKHPEGANPINKKNDCAAGIYVVFKKSLFSVRSIKYVWVPEGEPEHLIRTRYDYPQITIRVNKDNLGKWITEERNVAEDYEKLWGKKPGNVVAIGIITEADSVKVKKAIADYDDFLALKEPTGHKTPLAPVKKPEQENKKKDADTNKPLAFYIPSDQIDS